VKNKGFTLVELLITMAIMALIMAVAGFNYNQYSQFWHKRFGNFDQQQAQMRGKLQLRDALNAMAPYIVKNSNGDWVYYFLGREEGLTFITYAPIFAQEGGTSVVRVFREPQQDGNFRLIYEEAPLSPISLTQVDQVLNFQYRLVIADDLPEINFSYFGWPNRDAKYNKETSSGIKASWSNNYDGAETKLQPDKVKISSAFVEFNLNVAAGDKKLLNLFLPDDL
jgi:prepilin-type N-terminal cleavage/methylation domain-containing protein